MQHSESQSHVHHSLILGRPCPQLDQALADLTQELVAQADRCGHALIVIDHQETMPGLFEQADIHPVLIDFAGEQRLNPLARGFFAQPSLAALCLVNSVYRHANAWGERLRNTISSQAEVAWLYNDYADTQPQDQLHPANCDIVHDTTSEQAVQRAAEILATALFQDLMSERIVPNPSLATVRAVNSIGYTAHHDTVAPMRNHLHNLIGNQAYRLAATQPELDLRQALEPGRITLFNIPLAQLGNAATLVSNAILQNALYLAHQEPRTTPLHVIVDDASPLCFNWDAALNRGRSDNVRLHLRAHRLRDFHAPPAVDQWQVDDLLYQLDEITSANLDRQDRVRIAQEAAERHCLIRTRRPLDPV